MLEEITERIVGERDDGSHVEIGLGDTLVFHLTENASTGYRWKVAEVVPALMAFKERKVRTAARVPGAAAAIAIVLEPRETGDARVTLTLCRAWEPGAGARSISVSVSIR